MNSVRPYLMAIENNDYQAKHIGRTEGGLQFFLTTSFESAIGDFIGCEYIALFNLMLVEIWLIQ